jgi:hypothetical protein
MTEHSSLLVDKLYTVAEVLAIWPDGARPTEKRLRALARRIGACRICGRLMIGTGGRETAAVPSATAAIAPPGQRPERLLLERCSHGSWWRQRFVTAVRRKLNSWLQTKEAVGTSE